MGSRQRQHGSGSIQDTEDLHLGGLGGESTTASISSQMSEVRDGCIVLGKDAGKGNTYVTRFRILRDQQLKSVTGDICQEECFPCVEEVNRKSVGKFIWTLLNSEPLLLCLHLSAVIFGAAKEGLRLKDVAEDMHITASSVETYVALQIVVTRVVGAWQGYKSLSKARRKVEYVESGEVIHTPQLRRSVRIITALGVILSLGLLLAYTLFFIFGHLTWTILTNNFAIIVITASSGLLMGRINSELAGITDDQHKAVIYESMLLLTEGVYSKKREAMIAKTNRFCKALRDTKIFEKPDHIDIPHEQRIHLSVVSNLELQSIV